MKSSDSRQLAFVLADDPIGSDDDRNADESAGRAYLLHEADVKETTESDAETIDTSRLLERAASMPNLSRALLNVARNKGAPGIDGQHVREVVEHAPGILVELRKALLAGLDRTPMSTGSTGRRSG